MTSSSKKFLCIFKIKFHTKRIFRIFPMLRINEMAPFCNLFIERPSYILSLCLNGHFPGGPGLAGTRMSPFWILLKQDDRDGGDNWSYNTCKAPVKSSPPTNQHPVVKRRMPFRSPNQQCQSTEGKN